MTEEKTLAAAPQPQQQQPEGRMKGEPAQPVARRKFIPLVVLVIVAGAAFLIWKLFFSTPAVPDSIVQLSGRIEGDDSAVAPKTAGRILEVRVREGDMVKAGDVIAILDDQQVRDRQDQAQAAL